MAHPEMVRLLGRLRYRTSYGQNDAGALKEVARLTELMALELHLDGRMARRAGLFHDIGKAIDYERRTHRDRPRGVAQYGEPLIVQSAIASHHEDVEVISPISVLVAAADARGAPGARRHYGGRRIEQLEAGRPDGRGRAVLRDPGRPRDPRDRPPRQAGRRAVGLLASTSGRKSSKRWNTGKIKVTVIREMRAVDYAR